MLVRQAARFDAPRICALLNRYPQDAALLPRTQTEVCSAIDTFLLAEDEDGHLLGCGALHRYEDGLAEIRSIAVRAEQKGCGIGSALLQALLARAEATSIAHICLFTRCPEFFHRHGFVQTSIDIFPQKKAKDCIHCSRAGHCDEVAMVWSAQQSGQPVRGTFPTLQERQLVSLI